jgi:hypothetical protein
MPKTRSARRPPAKDPVDSQVEEPLQQEHPSTPVEDISRNKGPSIKIKFTLPVQSKKGKQSDGTVQSAPLSGGHSESLESVGEQLRHSGM